MKIAHIAPGLELRHGRDGYWLSFKKPSGHIEMSENVASSSEGRIIQLAKFEWCQDFMDKNGIDVIPEDERCIQ